MKEDILKWIEVKGSYEIGLALLLAAVNEGKANRTIYELCAAAKSTFTRNKIESELKATLFKMGTEVNAVQPRSILPQNNVPVKKQKLTIDPATLPEDLRLLDERIKELYGMNRIIRGQLRGIFYRADGNVRSEREVKKQAYFAKDLALESVRNQKSIVKHYKQLDYFVETGMRIPGTDKREERDVIIHWLRNLILWTNYVRKSNTYFKKHGKHQNPDLYREYSDGLYRIKEFLKDE